MSNATIEAEARRRGMSVDELFRETSQRVLQHRTPAARAASLLRESRRISARRETRSAPISKATTKAARVEPNLTPQLEEAFVASGMSPAKAKIAAAGRHASASHPGSLIEVGKQLGLMPAAARTFARGRHGLSEAVKNVAGLPAECFAWVPDPEDPTTWQMQISRNAGIGSEWSPDEDLVRAAVAQLPGVATYGKALDIPAADLPAVKANLRSAWIAAAVPLDEMPPELNQEALRRAFLGLGLSSEAAAVAARGRERRL
jgi:hypothetical protein